jgi:hypothetical protein
LRRYALALAALPLLASFCAAGAGVASATDHLPGQQRLALGAVLSHGRRELRQATPSASGSVRKAVTVGQLQESARKLDKMPCFARFIRGRNGHSPPLWVGCGE